MESIVKLRCTEETDFVVLNYDQSDIEEIEECPDHLEVYESTNCANQPEDENTPTNSIHKNDSHPDVNDEINLIDTSSGIVNQLIEEQQIHGSQSGLSNCSDSEPVTSSFDDFTQETCTISPTEDNGLNVGDGDGDDDDDDDDDDDLLPYDEDEINEIMDLTTIKRHRAYLHTPNSTAKLRLNLMVCFVITAGIFLGLGNYLGWSANWTKTKTMMTLNDNHIAKLKSLQDELAACMNSKSKGDLTLEPRRMKRKDLEGDEVVDEKGLKERELREREERELGEKEEKEEKEIEWKEMQEIEERERIEREMRERELNERENSERMLREKESKEREEIEQREREFKEKGLREERDRGERRERRGERREKKKKEDKDERKRDERKKEERKREERDRKKKKRDKERRDDL